MTKNFLARCRFEPASFDLLMTMPFEPTFWAFRFGMLADQFGIPWMIHCEKAS